MKARLKETGIIIELDEYCYDLDGNEYKWDELDLMIEPDWSSFRREAAKDILQSIIVTASQVYEMESLDKSIWCEQAIEWADTLIAKLKEK